MSVNNNIHQQEFADQFRQFSREVAFLKEEVTILKQQVTQGFEQLNQAISTLFRNNMPNPEPFIFPSHPKTMAPIPPKNASTPISYHQKYVNLATSLNNEGKHIEAEKVAKEGLAHEEKLPHKKLEFLSELNLQLARSLNNQKKLLDAEKRSSSHNSQPTEYNPDTKRRK